MNRRRRSNAITVAAFEWNATDHGTVGEHVLGHIAGVVVGGYVEIVEDLVLGSGTLQLGEGGSGLFNHYWPNSSESATAGVVAPLVRADNFWSASVRVPDVVVTVLDGDIEAGAFRLVLLVAG